MEPHTPQGSILLIVPSGIALEAALIATLLASAAALSAQAKSVQDQDGSVAATDHRMDHGFDARQGASDCQDVAAAPGPWRGGS